MVKCFVFLFLFVIGFDTAKADQQSCVAKMAQQCGQAEDLITAGLKAQCADRDQKFRCEEMKKGCYQSSRYHY